jgi:hypothetical protein
MFVQNVDNKFKYWSHMQTQTRISMSITLRHLVFKCILSSAPVTHQHGIEDTNDGYNGSDEMQVKATYCNKEHSVN